MQEINTSSNVEITPAQMIIYRGVVMSSYEQLLPPVADMPNGATIYVEITGDIQHKVVFKTMDGSIIKNDSSTYEANVGDKLIFIVGQQKYSVYDLTIGTNGVDHNDVVIQELKNDILTNATEITDLNTNLTKATNDITQLESDMVDVQATTTGNNDQLAVHSTEISTLNNNISTNTLSIATNIGKINEIESNGTGHSESIDGIQTTLSQILTQASGFSRRNYNSGFIISKETSETIFMPNAIVNEAWLNPVNSGYELLQGKEYVIEAEWTSDTVLTKEIQISFELQDKDNNGVYDINDDLIRDVHTIPVGEQVGKFMIQGHFIPDETGVFKMMIVCTPGSAEDLNIRNINNASLLYEEDGLIKFLKNVLKVQEVVE